MKYRVVEAYNLEKFLTLKLVTGSVTSVENL